MELSKFRPMGPEVFGADSVLFAAVLLCAAVPWAAFPLVADVVTLFTARTENQQSRSRSRTNTREEAIPTTRNPLSGRRTEHKPIPPLLIKSQHGRARLV